MKETTYEAHGYEHWRAELDPGSIQLSRCIHNGHIFGHSWESSSANPLDAARLLLAARKQVRKWGATSVFIHFEGGEGTREFWTERIGARLIYEVYEVPTSRKS